MEEKERIELTDKEFTKKLEEIRPYILREAHRLCRTTTLDAEDLAQDTLLRIWNKRHQFTYDESFRAWCNTVLKSVFINQIKAVKMKYSTTKEDDSLPIYEYSSSYASENLAISNICLADIEASIESVLNEKEIFAIKKFFIEGYTQEEIAKLLNDGSCRNTIKQRVFTGVRKLREELKTKFDIDESHFDYSDELLKKALEYRKEETKLRRASKKRFNK